MLSRHLFACLLWLSMWAGAHAENTIVPDLRGQPQAYAQQLLRLADLEGVVGMYYIAPPNWRDNIQPDRIYLQTPQPGWETQTKSIVAGWVLKPATSSQPVLAAPDLTGMKLSAAQQKLREVGLDFLAASGNDASEPRVVVEQYPRPGQSVYAKTSVFLRTERPVAVVESVAGQTDLAATEGVPQLFRDNETARLGVEESWRKAAAALTGGLVFLLALLLRRRSVRRRTKSANLVNSTIPTSQGNQAFDRS